MRQTIVLISIFLLIFLVHLSFINNSFTWLDHGDIERGRVVLPLSRLPAAFTTRFGSTGFYRPLVTVFNSIDFALFRLWAPGFHLTNTTLHLAATFTAAQFLALFFSLTFPEKLLTMIIIGLHPISSLPVGVISYRQELLVALFSFVTISFHIKAHQNKNFRYNLLSSAFFLLALFSKETALFLVPSIILLWEILYKPKTKNYHLFFSEISVLVIYLILRYSNVPELWRTSGQLLPLPEYIGTRILNLGKILIALLLPLSPSLSDAAPVISLTNPIVLLILILLFTLLFFIFLIKKNGAPQTNVCGTYQCPDRANIPYHPAKRDWYWDKNISISLILLAISLMPALNIIPLPRFYSPHYGYIAVPFIAAMTVLFLRKSAKKNVFRRISHLAVGLWLIIAAYSTFQAGFRFENDLALFGPEVIKEDRFLEGHQYLGDYFFRQKNYDLAEKHYSRSLKKDPKIIAFVDEGSVMNNLAGVYLAQKKYTGAENLLIELSKKPGWENNPTLIYNRLLIKRMINSP